MAQAARLNLRMQKELKLLLTDPPPGASFPQLSGESDICSSSSFSLSRIDAQIEGPEGTVYAKGIFKIKIHIPERYPFQPPSVTFATPIYHPNIDTGGRICLDILNLPPKGAWQPSLNISTVLTSIGLLLSEPNPDDGLMCEASREYKYDRQVFDQKAQSMTEKYAKAGTSENSSSLTMQTNTTASTMDVKGMSMVPKHEVDEYIGSHSKQRGICRKLSWESSDSKHKKDGDREVNEAPNQCLKNQMVVKRPKKEPNGTMHDCSPSHEKPCTGRQKLSLESMRVTKKNGNDKENEVPNYSPSLPNSHCSSMASNSLSGPQTINLYEQQSRQDRDSKSTNDCLSITSGKPRRIGRRLTLESSKMSNVDDNNVKKISGCPPHSPSSQVESNVFHKALPNILTVNHNGLPLNKDCTNGTGHEFTHTKQKKPYSFGKKLSLGLLGSSKTEESDNKEIARPTHEVPMSHPKGPHMDSSKSSLMFQEGECDDLKSEKCKINTSSKKCRIIQKAREPLGQWLGSSEKQQSNEDEGEAEDVSGAEESPMPDTIVVLDSEDSDEERNVSQRSRLPLACKRLAGKWRAKA